MTTGSSSAIVHPTELEDELDELLLLGFEESDPEEPDDVLEPEEPDGTLDPDDPDGSPDPEEPDDPPEPDESEKLDELLILMRPEVDRGICVLET